MATVAEAIDEIAGRTGFSGVVRVDEADGSAWSGAYGQADRAHGIANTADTIFGLASGGKGFTALTVASLIDEGTLAFDTTARSILGDDLPLIRDDVTVELLLAHRSGIGDYLDEDEWEVTDVVMPVSVHRLAETEDFVPILDGFPMAFEPDELAIGVQVEDRLDQGIAAARHGEPLPKTAPQRPGADVPARAGDESRRHREAS